MRGALALTAALAVVITGCGTTAQVSHPNDPTVLAPLGTSLVTAQGTWAIAVMGGSAADENNFWELFVRPAAGGAWKVVTPPAVADNGGLVAAGSPSSLLIGFRPSQDLTFSPLATSTSTGENWTAGLLTADLANVPDALATAPGGHELALRADGIIDTSADGGATWSRLPALATSAAGRSCRVGAVNAIAFWANETPIAAVTCKRPGVAGVFLYTAGRWRQDGPPLPAAYARDQVRVLRLSGTTALLQAGPDLVATWWSGAAWASPVVLPAVLQAGAVRASGFGANGSAWVILNDGTAETISGPGGVWQALPALPARTTVLAPGPAYEALTADGSRLTIWQLAAGAWAKDQSLTVPIVYGSSG